MSRLREGSILAVLAMCAVGAVTFAKDIPDVEEKPAAELPLCFRGRPQERLKAEEVARLDACRKLLERIYGFQLDARTDVLDLLLRSDELQVAVEGALKGMREMEKSYHDDGRVQVQMKVTLLEVLEVIERTYKRVEQGDRLVSEETIENVRRKNRYKDFVAIGWGALADSEGLDKIRAMRAAEIDCYRRIAERVFGMQINADTRVRDFVLANDAITTKVCLALPCGVKFTKYEFFADGTCAATGQITIRQVVEVLTRTHRRYGEGCGIKVEEIENIERESQDLVIEEVGQGVVGEPPEEEPYEVVRTTVIRRVLERKLVPE